MSAAGTCHCFVELSAWRWGCHVDCVCLGNRIHHTHISGADSEPLHADDAFCYSWLSVPRATMTKRIVTSFTNWQISYPCFFLHLRAALKNCVSCKWKSGGATVRRHETEREKNVREKKRRIFRIYGKYTCSGTYTEGGHRWRWLNCCKKILNMFCWKSVMFG